MECANVRESPRLHKGYAEPRNAQRWLHNIQPLLRGRDDESRMNTVCIGINDSMQRPIGICRYIANRRTKYVWWFGPKGDGMRSHRVVIVPLHSLPGVNTNLVVYEAHHDSVWDPPAVAEISPTPTVTRCASIEWWCPPWSPCCRQASSMRPSRSESKSRR